MAIKLYDIIGDSEAWGREKGRQIYQKLIDVVETHPGVAVFNIILEGVERVDASFASETLVELARRYRGDRGFCFLDMPSESQENNWDSAAFRKGQPLMLWHGDSPKILGLHPSTGLSAALQYALERESCRASDFALREQVSVANSSSKFKQLWQQGFLLRRESAHPSGGVEFLYYRIK